jgi:hypothetical protein
VERFHKTMLNEFYRIAFRKKLYRSIVELQTDLDEWIEEFNLNRPHHGCGCFGKTPKDSDLVFATTGTLSFFDRTTIQVQLCACTHLTQYALALLIHALA